MRVGILGSGRMGGKLGTIFARAGHDVLFSYARSGGKLERLAREAGPSARAGTPREAVEYADTLLLAVNWWQMDDVLDQAGDLEGKVLITCSLPMADDDSELAVAHTSSGAEELAAKAPGAHVVSAFGTVPSEVLFPVFDGRADALPPALLYSGDDEAAKERAAVLIRDAGFEPVDVGTLRMARYSEPFTLIMAELAYESSEGPEVAYRFERFPRK